MESLSSANVAVVFLGFGIMLATARIFGEVFTYFKHPAIVGEIAAGIVLGPTILGMIAPDFFSFLFPTSGPVAIAYSLISTLSVVFLLMIAGLEIDLRVILKQGSATILVSLFGVIVPFALGAGLAYLSPVFWGMTPGSDPVIYALFLGIALSISALPVIAKIMLDLRLFKTDVGLLVMGAAMLNDLIGWLGFAIVLSMLQTEAHANVSGLNIWETVGITIAVFVFGLTFLRWGVHRILPHFQAHLSWPGAVIAFTIVLTLLGASLTEAIGIHAVFGAFLAGVIVGDSKHLRERTRDILTQFVTYVFAPIFLVYIGINTNFVTSFNLQLTLLILLIAFVGKFAGCMLGAYLGGLSQRDSLAISFGMNARGTMEIILALLALQYGVIQSEVFVALVVLAIVSSVISGPLMDIFITTPDEWKLNDYLSADAFVADLPATTREEAIKSLSAIAAQKANLDSNVVQRVVLLRESLMGTSLGNEIAVPHARFAKLEKPVLVVGHSRQGLDFKSSDGQPSRLIFLLLTPHNNMVAQSQLIEQIENLFKDEKARRAIYETKSFDEVRAVFKTESAPMMSENNA